jgi:arginyl-tRNA synthetase
MQAFNALIKQATIKAITALYNTNIEPQDITVNETKADFEGDYTLVTFNISKLLRKSPAQIAQELGDYFLQNEPSFLKYNVVQGFLNISFKEKIILEYLNNAITNNNFTATTTGKTVMVEFSSPNTNKPLHFGHMRNNFLGDSVSNILIAAGNKVVRANLVNDRGIHICKSMYTWMLEGNGATPETTATKGDHFVGQYYVRFETILKAELQVIIAEIEDHNFSNIGAQHIDNLQKLLAAKNAATDADKQKDIQTKINELLKLNTTCMLGAQKLLLDWENNDPETRRIWSMMNSWVYAGFEKTYARSGITW